MTTISESAHVYRNVKLGNNVTIEDFCIIGAPPRGHSDGDLLTEIGDNSIIRSHTVIYAGNRIGNNFQTGNKANLRESNIIGDDVSVGTMTVIEHHIEIGRGVRIHSQAFIPEYSILEEDCWIGPNVVLTNAKYPKSRTAKADLKGPTIRRGAKIGANSTVLPGVIIGENALVGAGSLVSRDVSDAVVVCGNPARQTNKLGPDY